MSTNTHTSSTTSQTTGGQDKLTALHEQISDGVAALVGSDGWRAMLDTAAKFHSYRRGQPAADRRTGPAGHPGCRVPHLAEPWPAGTQGGAGHRDPGPVHLPPQGSRPGRAGLTRRAGAGHQLQRGSR